jgi:hypothetical protein
MRLHECDVENSIELYSTKHISNKRIILLKKKCAIPLKWTTTIIKKNEESSTNCKNKKNNKS